MKQEPKEIQIDTLEAKILKLKSLKQIAEEGVRDAIELKEGYLLEIDNLENELTEKNQELSEVLSAISLKREELLLISKRILQVIESLNNKVEDKKEELHRIEQSVKEQQLLKSNLSRMNSSVSKDFFVLKDQLEQKEEKTAAEIETIQEQKNQEIETLLQLQENKDKANTQLNQLVKEIKSKEDGFKQREEAIKQKEEELKQLSKQNKEIEQNLTILSADLNIIKRRIKKKYEELFPGRKLTI